MTPNRVSSSQFAYFLLICTLYLGCGKPVDQPIPAESSPSSESAPELPADSKPSSTKGPISELETEQPDNIESDEPSSAKPEAEKAEPSPEENDDPVSEPSAAVDIPNLPTEPVAKEEEPEPQFEEIQPEIVRLPEPEGADPMPEPHLVWIDRKQGAVIVDGYVSLREGMLEMFACPVGTKEHESIVAVYSQAQIVHAALLVLGAEVGTPVKFDPEFKPPTGTEIAIEVHWLDEEENWQQAAAQDWILDIKTNKSMTHPWVFAGSGFWKDEESGEEFYMAESGDFICVSNFSTAMLDIPVESSQVNEGLLFEANPEKVPPVGTPVRLILKPKK